MSIFLMVLMLLIFKLYINVIILYKLSRVINVKFDCYLLLLSLYNYFYRYIENM